MTLLTVVIRPRRAVAFQQHLCALGILTVALAALPGCDGSLVAPSSPTGTPGTAASSPPSAPADPVPPAAPAPPAPPAAPDPPPVPSAPQVGVFEGTVKDAESGAPIKDVMVDVLTGPYENRATFTNEAGMFRIELPAGTTRFRFAKGDWVSREEEATIVAGQTITLHVVLQKVVQPTMPPPPYTVRGTVIDSRGTAVGGAEIWIYDYDSPIDNRYGSTFADSSGRYIVTSPTHVPRTVRAQRDGYFPNDTTIKGFPDAASTWTLDVIIRRITRYALISPVSMKVGQTARLQSRVDLDDGSTSTGSAYNVHSVSSDNPSVVQNYHQGLLRALAPGTATIRATYYGVPASIEVRVEPQ